MDKIYQPEALEKQLYRIWEESGVFKSNPKGKKTFCLMLPPPNVTGSLHMGHAFQHTLMDILIRYHHMLGDNTHWQVGTDHAGIATQMVVENQLAREQKTRHDLGREAFVKRIWAWKEESGSTITGQMRRLGLAIDWEHERFTMNPEFVKAVITAFVKLYDEDLIYRGKRLVNWDPVFKTAVSDLEVIPTEEQGSLWHIRYPLKNGKDSVIVATTRPETMLGDVAVAIHPEDVRYQHLIGKTVPLPLVGREIPIIADTAVDISFGTGCVKITPAHDFNDYAMAQRHKLPLINIFTDDAKLNENVPEVYRGLDRFAARKQILHLLEAEGLLVKTEPHILKAPRNDRGGAIIEPYLMDQWYVNTQNLAKAALKAAKKKELEFIPENWINTYNEWLENIQDWCISRQLWWGHRIPAWYDESGKIYVAEDEATVRKKYDLKPEIKLTQDEDVLDTWFSSALWPFATLGWPEKTEMLTAYYPTSVLITGFDIIFFWVARMVMFGLKFMKTVPFEKIYITGLIRDHDGQKMSKSKGNVIDPIDLIDGISLPELTQKRTAGMMQERLKEKTIKATEKQFPEGIQPHGTDALRFTFAALASHSRDINFDVQRLEGYRNFCNKLWNAARFVLMNLEGVIITKPKKITHPLNQWLINCLHQQAKSAAQHLENYRFDLLAQELHKSVWNDYCDWYLECAKVLLQNEATRAETYYVLVFALEALLRFLHPIIPFITESIWHNVAPKLALTETALLQRPYPDAKEFKASAIDEVNMLFHIITEIRTFRSENQINPSKVISILFSGDQEAWAFHEKNLSILNQLARMNLQCIDKEVSLPANLRLDINNNTYYVPLADFIDVAVELKRAEKELNELAANITNIENKLNNPGFVDKAPAQVVAKERERLREQKQQQEKLLAKIADLKKL
jgi:valyl-tRNA synthetase